MGSLVSNKNFLISIGILFILTYVASLVAEIGFVEKMGFSLLIVSILIGMFLSNVLMIKVPEKYEIGLNFCTKTVLRTAIVFYGFRITFNDIVEVGFEGIAVSVTIVATTFVFGYIIGVKFLKMDKELVILTSAGSSICGAAAVLATEGVLKNKAYKSAMAVSTVVLFGTISMFLYPYMYSVGMLDLLPKEMAVYIGGTLHEVAHVVGASNSLHDTVIANNGVIVKMLRVMLIAPFLILLSIFLMKTDVSLDKSKKRKITIPWFAVFFIAVAIFNSFGIVNKEVIGVINKIDIFALAMAMMSLGISTKIKDFKKSGIKPLILALILFFWLVIGGYYIVKFYSYI